MTAYIAYLIKFLYRIKWWLLICPIVVAIMVYFYVGKQARNYKSATTIYTGIVSGYGPESGGDSKQDWNTINNAMDNLINIILSQTTLHNVSLRLYARSMSLGDPEKDTNYLQASSYRAEWGHTPQEVRDLIVSGDEDQTYQNLLSYESASHDNHVYGLFHWTHPYYSYQALSRIQVRRVSNSDMIDVSYENNDPGIVFNTLEILNDEFVKQYRELRFGETNNVIAFFEAELRRVGNELQIQEDSLRDYNIEKQVINYDEQTKHIAILSRDFELRNEEIRLSYNSAEQLRVAIEAQIDGLQTFRNNAAFVERLHNIGDLQSRITTAEFFSSADNPTPTDHPNEIRDLRKNLAHETDSLRSLTSVITAQRYTKEGIATNSLVQQWLEAVLQSEKAQAEMSIMADWKKSLDDRYELYAPVGSTLKRKNRLIGFTEQSYLSILQALNTARLRQKNLQMTSATLKIINPPVLPISAEPTKRKLMVFASYFATLFFLLSIFVLLELLDRTLRDRIRTERVTGGKVIGAFPKAGNFGQRRFAQQYREIATRTIANAAMNYFAPGKCPNLLNVLSTESGDGKSTLIENLADFLRETGMKVRVVSWNNDFKPEQRDYLLATEPQMLVPDREGEIAYAEADVVLIEYPPLSEYPIPAELLRSGALNIVTAPANRTWKETDQTLYEKAINLSTTTPTVICLMSASRDVVQSFTGLLPPYTKLRKLGYQISQFGFTAVK